MIFVKTRSDTKFVWYLFTSKTIINSIVVRNFNSDKPYRHLIYGRRSASCLYKQVKNHSQWSIPTDYCFASFHKNMFSY